MHSLRPLWRSSIAQVFRKRFLSSDDENQHKDGQEVKCLNYALKGRRIHYGSPIVGSDACSIQSSSVTTVSDMCEPKISSHVVGELFLWGKWGEDTHHAQDISDLTRATVDGRRYPRHSCRWYPSTHTKKMYPHHDHDTLADTTSEM